MPLSGNGGYHPNSYFDSMRNLETKKNLNKLISFDKANCIFKCEKGITFEKISNTDTVHQKFFIAKEVRLPKDLFEQFYPNFNTFKQYIDPKFSSSFWRRINE